MKKLFSIFSIIAMLGMGLSANGYAEEDLAVAAEEMAPSSEMVETTTEEPVAMEAVAEEAVATEEVAEEEDVLDTGDTALTIIATVLVILMIIPGLALFYGGLVRQKICCQSFCRCLLHSLLAPSFGQHLDIA